MTEAMQMALVSAGSALLGGILGGLLSGAYQHWRDWHNRPRLQIDYEPTGANRVEASYKDDKGSFTKIYIRARVRNTGCRTAKGALVYLTALKEVHASGKTTTTSFYDSMPLAWAGWNFKPRDVPPAPGVCFYVDLMRVSERQPGLWLFSVEKLLKDQLRLQNYSGTYRFELTLTADNAEPAISEVDVHYTGDWQQLRAVSVSKPPTATR